MTGLTDSSPQSRTVLTSGILVVLRPNPDTRQQLLRWLWALPSVDVGSIESGLRLNIAARHPSVEEERDFLEALQSHPGVQVISRTFSQKEAVSDDQPTA